MASPTAIPHAQTSSHRHHNQQHAPPASSPPRVGLGFGSSATNNNNRNSPPLLSPIYARTAFSLPGGPVSPSNSFRNTASGAWTTAGVNVGGALKSPTAIASQQTAQKDYFPERDPTGMHHRSSSMSSTTSSVDSNGPPTPRTGEAPGSLAGGAPLGRVRSIPLPSSYEAIKGSKEGWNGSQGWAGLSSFRSQSNAAAGASNGASATSPPAAGGGGMGHLFRRLSMSGNPAAQNPHRRENNHHHHQAGHGHRSASISYAGSSSVTAGHPPLGSAAPVKESTAELAGAPVAPAAAAVPDAPGSLASPSTVGTTSSQKVARGRRGEAGASIKRKPSPHGERLLMGWTHAH
ncbi:hypothetical protein BCV69DRAFT_69235 [Microstroma glucosiphilum]|uniref:Uncharacterized protein n=1 Tax=Pseudomicrostroma glucosiphilum TaxID=1684307 RepID=A0A316TZP1_9BASI|nr:hypothetical protein BCV69DRAFT_69235 [Pseudomicrostroma glucosiphilum]PWN18646.1 hypothetical protein BCV69DRAFT_69235 [Pseudomicrostroma glucosiphilum]